VFLGIFWSYLLWTVVSLVVSTWSVKYLERLVSNVSDVWNVQGGHPSGKVGEFDLGKW